MKVLVLLLVSAVAGAQTARVVPVDLPTASNLAILAKKAKDAQQAYDAAVKEAQHRLLTTRDRKVSSRCFAFREGDDNTALSGTGLTFGSTGTISLSYDSRCETAEEKKSRIQRETEEHVQHAKWDAEHPERYWLDGFCYGSAEFTDDFRYMTPKPTPEVHPSPFNWNGGVTPLTLRITE